MAANSAAVVVPVQKLTFKQKYVQFKQNLSKFWKNLANSDDFKSFTGITTDVILSGIFLSLALSLVGLPITLMNFLALGAGFWFFSDKIFPQITAILNSITLVKIR
jgi:hypothetical protein